MRDATQEKRENENALKHLFGREMLRRTAGALQAAYPKFDRKRFESLLPRLEKLEMKPRVRLIRDELRDLLPTNYKQAVAILLRSARSPKLQAFDLWPYTEYVQTFGLEQPELSLKALKELTTRFTAEWAVRPFLIRYPETALPFLMACARDQDHHVRRWASEGSRPRLPWGERLRDFVRDPAPVIPILETLKFDPELYVRKSVANHLNDIAKDHPGLVVKVLSRWQEEAGEEHARKVDWIVRRALRTLIKAGHPEALELVGVAGDLELKVMSFRVAPKRVRLGGSLDLSLSLRSTSRRSQKLVIDYVVHFKKAHGGTAPKVFKLRNVELPAGATISLNKRHAVKKITTRVYYPGLHAVELQVNGKILARAEWALSL